jgi:molybdopterin/thiamine biosynthesis adenylyltransferase/rhodanese-related sulfurtransferase
MAERTPPASVSVRAGSRSLRRYSRHLLIPEVGLAGQERLARARVLVVGAGGLGAPVLQYLAAAGVGTLGIVDDDVIDITNLQRQVIYGEADVGASKAVVAAARVHALNASVACEVRVARFDAGNARELVRAYDIVADCTDTFGARYLINDACWFEGKPDVYASIFRFEGQVSVFRADGPCYRCLFSEPPPEGSVPSCAEGGVLGVLAGMVGTWQANEVLKLVLGIGKPLVGRVALIDALDGRAREVAFAPDLACALHGPAATITELAEAARVAPEPLGVPELAADELDAYLGAHPDARVLDVREPHEAILEAPPQSVHIPATVLEARLHELDSAREYIVACRVGVKSHWAVGRLRDAGFRRLQHLGGGLLAYAAENEAFDAF